MNSTKYLRRHLLRTLQENGPQSTTALTEAIYGPCTERDHRRRAYRQWEARWIETYKALDHLRLIGELVSVPTSTSQLWCLPQDAAALPASARRALDSWVSLAPVLESA